MGVYVRRHTRGWSTWITECVETGRDFVDFLCVHLFSSVSLFHSHWSDVPCTLNILFTHPSFYMAPVLFKVFIAVGLIYMVLLLL